MNKLNKLLFVSAFAISMFQGSNAGLPEDAILLNSNGENVPVYLGLALFENQETNRFDTVHLNFADQGADLITEILAKPDIETVKQDVVGRICQNMVGYLGMEGYLVFGHNIVSTLRLDISRDLELGNPLSAENLQLLLNRCKPYGIQRVSAHYLVTEGDEKVFSATPSVVAETAPHA